MTKISVDGEAAKESPGIGWRLLDFAVLASRRRGANKKRRSAYPLVIPSILLIAILAVGLAYLIWTSFQSVDTNSNVQGGLSLDQYRNLFTGPSASVYRDTLLRTSIYALIVTVTAVCLAIPTAYAIVSIKRRLWRRIAMLLLLVPFLMGETVRAIGWVLIIGKDGVLSWVSRIFGFQIELLGSPFAIWLGMVQVMFPLATLVMMPAIRGISPNLEWAALTMGARPWQVWLRIIVPLARPGILGASLVVATLSMTEYLMPRILGLGKLPFAATTIQQLFFSRGNINLGSALSAVLLVFVISMVVIIVFLGKDRSRS